MPPAGPFPLIAVDIGNSRIKLGRFDEDWSQPLPEPAATLHLAAQGADLDQISGALASSGGRIASWWIGSVNRPAATRLLNWLRQDRAGEPVTLLAAGDLPISVGLARPDMAGVDRLLDAVAANALREPGRPAAVVDVGSAITVDLVSAAGEFLGGAILPGLSMSARALHTFTDLLPLFDFGDLGAPPPPLGADTVSAMRSGLFWGAVGAIRELVGRMPGSSSAPAQVFLTGGAAPAVAGLLGRDARFVPHLTLAGIALAARWQAATDRGN
jgi:type III pantothenate kinase